MRAGLLRRVVTLRRPVDTNEVDSTGDPVEEPVDLATVRAAINPLTGRELFDAQTTLEETVARINIRHFPGLKPKDQVVDGTDVWDIEAVLDLESRGREMELVAVLHG